MTHKKFLVPIFGVLALTAAVASADASQDELLANVTILKLGPIGLVSHISDEELALATILKEKGARSHLMKLLRDAKSNEAKLYALCGLRSVSPIHFSEELKRVRWDGETFNQMRADVVVKTPIKEQILRMRRHGCAVGQPR